MNKSEALDVMHEILDALKETVSISSVSLDHSSHQISKHPDDFQIKIKCNLDDYSRKCIQPILEKHNLKTDTKEDTVIIYSF